MRRAIPITISLSNHEMNSTSNEQRSLTGTWTIARTKNNIHEQQRIARTKNNEHIPKNKNNNHAKRTITGTNNMANRKNKNKFNNTNK